MTAAAMAAVARSAFCTGMPMGPTTGTLANPKHGD